jgi:hypothetical protein
MYIALGATNVRCWGNLPVPRHLRSAYPRRAEEASCTRDDIHSALRSTGALFGNRLDRHAACKATLTPSASGVDRTHLMLRGHIVCQRGGRRRPLHIKCRECAALGALRQAPPVGLCHGSQATRQQRVSA